MAFKDNVKHLTQKAKSNWKKTALISVAVLGVAAVGGGAGYALGTSQDQDMVEFADHGGFGGDEFGMGDFSDNDSQNTMSASYATSLTYDQWKSTVNDSSLSSDDKKTVLAAIEKSKTAIEKVTSLENQLDKLYTDNLSSLGSDFTSLMTNNSSLWNKLDDAWLPSSLRDISLDDITDLTQTVKDSDNLSDSEKSTLQADLTSLKTLKEKWSTAYATYTEKASDLESQLETAQNAVTTSLKDNKVTDDMLSTLFGGDDDWGSDDNFGPGQGDQEDDSDTSSSSSSSSSQKS